MKERQWVQHISGQGKKWEVMSENSFQWGVRNTHPAELIGHHWVPKSEFTLCSPPEEWKDVTEECHVSPVHIRDEHWLGLFHKDGANVHWPSNGYRLRKVVINAGPQGEPPYKWAFIVEKKVQP